MEPELRQEKRHTPHNTAAGEGLRVGVREGLRPR